LRLQHRVVELQRIEDQFAQRLGHRAAGRVLDHEPGQNVVRVVVLPLLAGRVVRPA
jgi:hypothetical protein